MVDALKTFLGKEKKLFLADFIRFYLLTGFIDFFFPLPFHLLSDCIAFCCCLQLEICASNVKCVPNTFLLLSGSINNTHNNLNLN